MPSKISDIQRQLERALGRDKPPVSAAAIVGGKPSSREGKVHIGAYLHPDFKSSLRLVQAQTGKDIQALLSQALNELFRAYNVPVVDQS
jgi:hypothetical protein